MLKYKLRLDQIEIDASGAFLLSELELDAKVSKLHVVLFRELSCMAVRK